MGVSKGSNGVKGAGAPGQAFSPRGIGERGGRGRGGGVVQWTAKEGGALIRTPGDDTAIMEGGVGWNGVQVGSSRAPQLAFRPVDVEAKGPHGCNQVAKGVVESRQGSQ